MKTEYKPRIFNIIWNILITVVYAATFYFISADNNIISNIIMTVGLIGLLLSVLLLIRNQWAHYNMSEFTENQFKRLTDYNMNLVKNMNDDNCKIDEFICYKLKDYNHIVFHFWIWDFKKFIEIDNNYVHNRKDRLKDYK